MALLLRCGTVLDWSNWNALVIFCSTTWLPIAILEQIFDLWFNWNYEWELLENLSVLFGWQNFTVRHKPIKQCPLKYEIYGKKSLVPHVLLKKKKEGNSYTCPLSITST